VYATGSARTIGNFDVVECLKSASSLLEKFGGHKQAAGLTAKTENLSALYEKILEFARGSGADTLDAEVVTWLDAEVSHRELALDTADQLMHLEPHGVGNSKPQFLIRGLTLLALRRVGNGGKHAQLTFKTQHGTIDGISFSGGEFWSRIAPGSLVDIAAELLLDTWQGRRKMKLRVCDIVSNQENPLVQLLPELAVA
jgi:single-stranded-DNA-specific exonuclease